MNELKLKQSLQHFFMEDIGDGDLTSENIFPENEKGEAIIKAKEAGIFCGKKVIETAFSILDPNANVQVFKSDGETVQKGENLAVIKGSICSILQGERVVLNLLQRMSGIATLTKKAVDILNSPRTKICDTRKTTPGLRMFEKYAVRTGGGYNHRFGLYDGVMIKDNHIAFCGSISKAVEAVRKRMGHMVKIEVEVETEEQVREALAAGVDIIMLDNMSPALMTEMVQLINKQALVEASGNVSAENIRTVAACGVDLISVGRLTHSVKALDISLQLLNE